MQLFGFSSLVVLALQGSVEAVQNAIMCTTTADCAWGETCVAGDSETSVQACVPPSVCGGSSMGNCPSDDSGKLACLWRPYNDCTEGCAILNGNKGIYKCVSLSRCNAYYGGSSCSDGCSVNGVRCNGQGSCNMMSSNADGTPLFGCTCDNGYSGEKCEFAPGSAQNASSSDNEDSFWGAPDDGSSKDSSIDGSNDDNTDDDSSTDTSNDSSTDASEDSSVDRSSGDSSTGASGDSSTDASDGSSSDNTEDENASSSSSASSSGGVATRDSVSSTNRSSIRPGVLILVLVMAAFFLVGTVLLVAYSRRRSQQQEEEYANALASTHGVGAVGERDIAAGHTGHTPRAGIATL